MPYLSDCGSMLVVNNISVQIEGGHIQGLPKVVRYKGCCNHGTGRSRHVICLVAGLATTLGHPAAWKLYQPFINVDSDESALCTSIKHPAAHIGYQASCFYTRDAAAKWQIAACMPLLLAGTSARPYIIARVFMQNTNTRGAQECTIHTKQVLNQSTDAGRLAHVSWQPTPVK